jgi:hypothetical protein
LVVNIAYLIFFFIIFEKGPLTAELVVKSDGRWSPVFLIAAAINCVGAIIYYSHVTASQII